MSFFDQTFQSDPINPSVDAGSVPSITNTTGSLLANGLATLNSMGPINSPFGEPSTQVLPTQWANSIAFGVESNWDAASMQQVGPIVQKIRLRAWKIGSYQHMVAEGTHLFGSLIPSMATPDKVSAATIPAINEMLERRAYDEARAEAYGKSTNNETFAETMTETTLMAKTFGASSPADFLDKWAYIGATVEPGDSNGIAEEPLWGYAVGGQGVTRMTNIFGLDVQPFDFLYLNVRFVANKNANLATEYTPQPKQILRICGSSGKGIPARNTNVSKTDWTPESIDVDSMRRGVMVPRLWSEARFMSDGNGGGQWTNEVKIPSELQNAELANSQMRYDLYEQGVTICVGMVVESRPLSTKSQKLLDSAHYNHNAYKTLPLITVLPFTRIY